MITSEHLQTKPKQPKQEKKLVHVSPHFSGSFFLHIHEMAVYIQRFVHVLCVKII